jgi:hypothetical protein
MSIPRTLRRGAAVTRSDAAGMFAFVNVPDGPAQLLFRRVGHMPTVIGVALPQGKDSLEVALAPTTALGDGGVLYGGAGCGSTRTPGGRMAPPYYVVIWMRS